MNKKVIIGMSGGVDSSVAAFLLKQQGYQVIGITLKLWQDDGIENEDGCCSLSAVEDARRVCDILDIPFYVLNMRNVFEEKVIDYFADEYIKGRTPNPCIACNKHIKFDAMLKKAMELDAWYVATGHYARVYYDEDYGRYLMKKSATDKKDQTYVLYNLSQEQLKHIVMPLGDYTKEQIREIASDLKMRVANKPESQEICFVKDNDYGRFLTERNGAPEQGYFVDKDGNKLGRHKGIIHYTVGQRKGLGIALGKPMFVVEIIPDRNLVVLGDESEVFSTELVSTNNNFILFDKLEQSMEVKAKIRYSAKEAAATIFPLEDDKVNVIFQQPQRAITPGQAVVFYLDDLIVGGGTIE